MIRCDPNLTRKNGIMIRQKKHSHRLNFGLVPKTRNINEIWAVKKFFCDRQNSVIRFNNGWILIVKTSRSQRRTVRLNERPPDFVQQFHNETLSFFSRIVNQGNLNYNSPKHTYFEKMEFWKFLIVVLTFFLFLYLMLEVPKYCDCSVGNQFAECCFSAVLFFNAVLFFMSYYKCLDFFGP